MNTSHWSKKLSIALLGVILIGPAGFARKHSSAPSDPFASPDGTSQEKSITLHLSNPSTKKSKKNSGSKKAKKGRPRSKKQTQQTGSDQLTADFNAPL